MIMGETGWGAIAPKTFIVENSGSVVKPAVQPLSFNRRRHKVAKGRDERSTAPKVLKNLFLRSP